MGGCEGECVGGGECGSVRGMCGCEGNVGV